MDSHMLRMSWVAKHITRYSLVVFTTTFAHQLFLSLADSWPIISKSPQEYLQRIHHHRGLSNFDISRQSPWNFSSSTPSPGRQLSTKVTKQLLKSGVASIAVQVAHLRTPSHWNPDLSLLKRIPNCVPTSDLHGHSRFNSRTTHTLEKHLVVLVPHIVEIHHHQLQIVRPAFIVHIWQLIGDYLGKAGQWWKVPVPTWELKPGAQTKLAVQSKILYFPKVARPLWDVIRHLS